MLILFRPIKYPSSGRAHGRHVSRPHEVEAFQLSVADVHSSDNWPAWAKALQRPGFWPADAWALLRAGSGQRGYVYIDHSIAGQPVVQAVGVDFGEGQTMKMVPGCWFVRSTDGVVSAWHPSAFAYIFRVDVEKPRFASDKGPF